MNNLSLIGRLVREPEVRWSNGETAIAYGSYTLAVDRPVRSGAEKVTDFIYCKVIGRNAEFAEKYLRQGMKIAVTGRIQVDSYTNNEGQKRSMTYVQVLNQEFCEKKESNSGQSVPPSMPTDSDGFMSIPDGIDEELPFN